MQGTMPGACRRGRPRTAWMDNIKTWTGLSMEESIWSINGQSTFMVWPTLGSRTAKDQIRSGCSNQRRGNLGGRVGSCPPNYNIGWAANVFCPPKKISQHISSRPNYLPVIPALVDSISDSRSLCALCSISQLVTSVNYLKN